MLDSILEECNKHFNEELGCFKGLGVIRQLKEDAQPKFMKSRKVRKLSNLSSKDSWRIIPKGTSSSQSAAVSGLRLRSTF